MKGGYLVIDLNNRNFEDGVGMVIDGLYERIESTRKPTLLENIVVENTELRSLFIPLRNIGSTFTADVTIGNIEAIVTINDNDVFTVTIVQ